jgi:hypothetical protein
MTLRITNPAYPHMGVLQHTFYVTISAALCNCATLTWTTPSLLTGDSAVDGTDDFAFTLPGVASGAYDINPYIRQCSS